MGFGCLRESLVLCVCLLSQTSLNSKEDLGRRRGGIWEKGSVALGAATKASRVQVTSHQASLRGPGLGFLLSPPPAGFLCFSTQLGDHVPSLTCQQRGLQSFSARRHLIGPTCFPSLRLIQSAAIREGPMTTGLLRAILGKKRMFSEINESWGWAVTPKDGHHCTWSTFIL